jgi:hypothetical protein
MQKRRDIKTGKKYPGTKWLILSLAEPDGSGNRHWWCLCSCRDDHKTPLAELAAKYQKRVREQFLRSGKSTSCGCARPGSSATARRRKSANSGFLTSIQQPSPQPETQQRDTTAKSAGENLALNMEGSTPPASSPPQPPLNSAQAELHKCPHGVYLTLTSGERETRVSLNCQTCTPPVPRHATYSPSKSIRKWDDRLKRHDLGMARGKAPEGSKNLVYVGNSADVERADFGNQQEELFGGRRRSAAGRDKIAPGQNPCVDYDPTADVMEQDVSPEAVAHLEQSLPKFDSAEDADPRVNEETAGEQEE